jgi:hypothetical protein
VYIYYSVSAEQTKLENRLIRVGFTALYAVKTALFT